MEANNLQATREALKKIYLNAQYICEYRDEPAIVHHQANLIERAVNAALSKPPRNCDVGTPEEQWRRFKKHCEENLQADDPDYCSSICDVDGGCVSECALKWAQMPYEANEKGEADDSNG